MYKYIKNFGSGKLKFFCFEKLFNGKILDLRADGVNTEDILIIL